ncbi:MAG: Do family serine endopeptidase [Cyclobacteriaceae bacterium]
MRNYILPGLIAMSVSLMVVWLAPDMLSKKTLKIEHINGVPARGALFMLDDNEVVPLDFTVIAEKVMDAVVHIQSTQETQYSSRGPEQNRIPDPFRDFFNDDFFDQFFGPRSRDPQSQEPQVRIGSGSGVLISQEGHIITNNHVVANSVDIEVTLHDHRTYKATIIGTDPSTDLALIQIDEKDLTTLPLVNSDEVKVGEWVLAVGNPFNLNSTVTAGIVSAKSRNINILRDQYAIESFIQTDAAINPGNSGGALVNLKGGLIGINTAIASPTGSYTGYGFAVPANIVSKVIEDLLKYGVVQRGYLGVTIRGLDGNLSREKNLDINTGVYIDSVAENSAASTAGLKPGDIITEVDEIEVSTAPELQEMIARHRLGDEVKLKVVRNKKELNIKVFLKNREGKTDFITKSSRKIFNILGGEFEDIDKQTADELSIQGGVRVTKLYAGKLLRHTEMREGFIITKIDGKSVRSKEHLAGMLESKKGGVLIEGIYPDTSGVFYYALGL